MSLADFPFRDEWEDNNFDNNFDHDAYMDAVGRMVEPIAYGAVVVEGNPLHAPYSDDQFAYFTDSLAYLNELPAEQYYRGVYVEKRSAICEWLNGYARFVLA